VGLPFEDDFSIALCCAYLCATSFDSQSRPTLFTQDIPDELESRPVATTDPGSAAITSLYVYTPGPARRSTGFRILHNDAARRICDNSHRAEETNMV
jgi:hypothetical protein